jgi:hypothetical protein
MQQNPRMAWLIIGVIMIFVFGSNLLQFALQPKDIWWTPMEMMLSPSDASDKVRVFIDDEPLGDVLDQGRLKLETDEGSVTLTEGNVGFRLNNYDRIRASQTIQIGITVAATTLAVVFLVYGLMPYFLRRKEESTEPR